jgi:hypothetical protein
MKIKHKIGSKLTSCAHNLSSMGRKSLEMGASVANRGSPLHVFIKLTSQLAQKTVGFMRK